MKRFSKVSVPSAGIVNVLAGVEASQTVTSLTLAIQGRGLSAALLACSAALSFFATVMLGHGAGTLNLAEQTIIERSLESHYSEEERKAFSREVLLREAPKAKVQLVTAAMLAVGGIILVMASTAVKAGRL